MDSMRDRVHEAYDGFADALGKPFVKGDRKPLLYLFSS